MTNLTRVGFNVVNKIQSLINLQATDIPGFFPITTRTYYLKTRNWKLEIRGEIKKGRAKTVPTQLYSTIRSTIFPRIVLHMSL